MSSLKKGSFFLPYNKALVPRARQMRKNPTLAEEKLWRTFKENPLFGKDQYRIWRQRPIDNFIVDFYIPKLKLIIEVDGDSHFTEAARAYDAERAHILESYGLTVLRFTNDEVLNNIDAVWQKIGDRPTAQNS